MVPRRGTTVETELSGRRQREEVRDPHPQGVRTTSDPTWFGTVDLWKGEASTEGRVTTGPESRITSHLSVRLPSE